MDKQTIQSTSKTSADCTDLVLRETTSTRLLFRPKLVENPSIPKAGVKGTFIFQRKGMKTEWEDTETIPLSSFKQGEGYRLELSSAEVLHLHEELTGLYRIHSKVGIPFGTVEYVQADSLVSQMTQLTASDLRMYLNANEEIGTDLVSKLLGWVTDSDDPLVLIQRLVTLDSPKLRKLNAAVGMASLKRALSIWKDNLENSHEEFWQDHLTQHSFLFEQVFSWPATIVKGKAYVGGKSFLNTGGSLVDFLVKNQVTHNAALVEIKTPVTCLLDSEYRNHVYNISEELSGGVQQVANYRHTLQLEYNSIASQSPVPITAIAPKCVLLIGNAEKECGGNREKAKSFELFRNNMTGVMIITFDELYQKARNLIEILESSPVPNRPKGRLHTA